MSNQKPERGYVVRSTEQQYFPCTMYQTKVEAQKYINVFVESHKRTLYIEEVELISPQELSRLRAIEAWAKEVQAKLWRYNCQPFAGQEEVIKFRDRFDAIPAPVEAK